MINTNLPIEDTASIDSKTTSKVLFDMYGQPITGVHPDDIASMIAFFQTRGFGLQAAISTSLVLLDQAKQQGTPAWTLLDTLKGLQELQLSAIVSEVLNNSRSKTSVIGYKVQVANTANKLRNVAA